MKRLVILLAGFALVFASCERAPLAGFYADKESIVVGEEIRFTNTSAYAHSYEWDFGDGYYSTLIHPSHEFNKAGVYDVSLTAYGNDGEFDIVYLTVTVEYIPVGLEVTVLEYYTEEPVVDASVILYPTLGDWEDESNKVVEGFTNINGLIYFEQLREQRYYIDVYHPSYNNYSLASEDVGFIETPILRAGETTEFIAWVDYDPGTLKSDRNKKYKIVKIEKRQYSDKQKK